MACVYEGCERKLPSKGAKKCTYHYQRDWRAANPDKERAMKQRYYEKNKHRIYEISKKWREKNIESVRATARYYAAKNAKNPVTQEHMTDKVKERFFAKVDKTDTCWNWTGAKSAWRPERPIASATEGYGVININGRTFYAHRASWLMHKGPLIPGLVIDHLCDNTLCVNPEHMQQVTNNENTKRSPKHTANGARYYKTHCKNGHERTEEMRGRSCTVCYPKGTFKAVCVNGHQRTPDNKGKRCPECYKLQLQKAKEQNRLKKLAMESR